MTNLNIINNPQFDLNYFTTDDKYVLTTFKEGQYHAMEEAILMNHSPFCLEFAIINDNGKIINHKDVPISVYTNHLIQIKKVVE